MANTLTLSGAVFPEFVTQQSMAHHDGYYEQIVFQEHKVPTRCDNWHDFFNALIWMLFPQSKQALNRLHIDDISQHGLSPRTRRRNHITHFDECGVILAYEDEQDIQALAEHQWQDSFIAQRPRWGQQIDAFCFGHANLEMLLNPFTGLTGKWLGVKVEATFWQMSLAQQYAYLDKAFVTQHVQAGSFNLPKPLKPLPLLGIPGWWPQNQDPDFYTNTDYFRPKPQASQSTV